MRLRGIGSMLVVALLVSSCSGSGNSDEGAEGDNPGAESTAEVPEGAVVEPSDGTVPQVGEPVGERQIVNRGWTMTLEMFPLQRDEGGLVLNARLSYLEAGPETAPQDMLSRDGAFSRAFGTPNGFNLVDKEGGKVYLPAVDELDSPLCSPDLAGNSPSAGDQVYVSCLFGAPPESTTEVDVRASRFGVFSSVPVE